MKTRSISPTLFTVAMLWMVFGFFIGIAFFANKQWFLGICCWEIVSRCVLIVEEV